MDEFYLDLVDTLMPLGICVVLPIVVVWLIIRARINRDNMLKEIILAALEKNTDIDVEDLMKKLNGPKTLLKEKQMRRLLIGSIFVLLGIIIYIAEAVFVALYGDENRGWANLFQENSEIAVPSLAIGLAFLLNYFVGKKMLAKEIEAEEENLRQSQE